MDKFLKKLQEKPEHERRRIVLGSSAVITLIIFGFWASSFVSNVVNPPRSAVGTKTVEVSPFSVLKSNLSTVYQGFSQSFQSSTTPTSDSPNNSLEYGSTTNENVSSSKHSQ